MFKDAAFACDVPEHGILKGDVGTVIEYFEQPRPGYMLEIFDARGNTVDIVTVPETSLERIREGQRWNVRDVDSKYNQY